MLPVIPKQEREITVFGYKRYFFSETLPESHDTLKTVKLLAPEPLPLGIGGIGSSG
jgi:hypothetical protein